MLHLDHLAVSAPTLDEGVAYVEQALGVTLADGGAHPLMATHNRLLKLGERLYLEVIAADPDAQPPGRARWFGLDDPLPSARLTNWVVRTQDLDAALARVPLPLGEPVDLERGRYRWRMAVPPDGRLPFGGAAPAVMQWQGRAHPAADLPEAGCRLLRLDVSHPQADSLVAAFPELKKLPDVRIETGPFDVSARIETPTGRWTLA